MATPITSPLISTYASRTPYLTPAEYIASPTGVDVSQLVPGGTNQQNADALAQTIARASSGIDSFCRKVLAATLDTQVGTYRVNRDGYILIKLDNTPIVQVNDVAVGIMPGQLSSLTDLSGVWVGRKVISVPIANLNFPPFGFGASKLYAVTKYVNGWTNCLLAPPNAATAGAATITVDNPLGIIPGLPVTIYDPGFTENVTVLSVSGNTVTLTAPLAFAHAVGVSVSALPPYVKEAAVLWTSGLIKTRGDDSYVMPAEGAQPSRIVGTMGDLGEDFALAADLLMPICRVS